MRAIYRIYSAGQVGRPPRTFRDYLQRLIEQPVGQGEVFAESGRVGRFHCHLVVDQYFSDEDGEPVPAHVEVEGRVTAVDATDDATMVSPSPYEALIRPTSRSRFPCQG